MKRFQLSWISEPHSKVQYWTPYILLLCQNNRLIGNLYWLKSLKRHKGAWKRMDYVLIETCDSSPLTWVLNWWMISDISFQNKKEQLWHTKEVKEIRWIQKSCNAFGGVHFLNKIKCVVGVKREKTCFSFSGGSIQLCRPYLPSTANCMVQHCLDTTSVR